MSKSKLKENKTKEQIINEIKNNYLKTFSTDSGQRVIEDMKTSLKHGQNVYYPGQSNNDLHFMLGRQSVINDILRMLEEK